MERGQAGVIVSDLLHLDTHIVVWLYAGEHHRFPPQVRQRLNNDRLRYSPMVALELTYLHETGKVTDPAATIIDELSSAVGLAADTQEFSLVITIAERLDFSRDPFDRIIVAQAIATDAALITKDERILATYPHTTFWR